MRRRAFGGPNVLDRSGIEREQDFRRVYDRYYGDVDAYVRRRVRSPEDVEEIVNAVFLVAWQKFDRLPVDASLRHWLLLTARYKIGNRIRSAQRAGRLFERLTRHRVVIVASFDLDQATFDDPVVLHAFMTLRPAQQEVLALVVWDGLSYAEAAAVLKCTVNTFGVRLNRARAAYRAAFEREMLRSDPSAGAGGGIKEVSDV
jgi:RNA polymerase sigma factor (sigma-70 family)